MNITTVDESVCISSSLQSQARNPGCQEFSDQEFFHYTPDAPTHHDASNKDKAGSSCLPVMTNHERGRPGPGTGRRNDTPRPCHPPGITSRGRIQPMRRPNATAPGVCSTGKGEVALHILRLLPCRLVTSVRLKARTHH